MGKWRVGLLATGVSVRIDHDATCPEVSPPVCATTEIPRHQHHQSVDWLRVGPSLSVGLGEGYQVSLGIPMDVRVLDIAYTRMNGATYQPPYGDIHHRKETLAGPVDGTLGLQSFHHFEDTPWTIGAGVGTTLPLGKTHPDPFALASEGQEHQHFQLGTGTFVPTAEAQVVLAGRWGGNSWVEGRFPAYTNRHGYLPGTTIGWGIGPRYLVVPTYTVALTVEGTHQWSDHWKGEPSPASARDTVMTGLANNLRLSGQLSIYGKGLVTVWQASHSADKEDQLLQRFVATLGVTIHR